MFGFGRFRSPSSPAAHESLRPDALPADTLLGNLRIERVLARGASAALYRATDIASGAVVAVKVLCPGSDDDGSARDAFLREAERAGTLHHPNIVQVFGGGRARGIAFLVMELLPGSDLTRWSDRQRLLPEAAVLDIAMQLAQALAHAHGQGVMHRDVKPANAIYDPTTQRAVLTDFGIARGPDAQSSRSGVLIGSPRYMAPELLSGQTPSAASDLYALAVLTFELLAGRPPFEAASMGALLRAVAQSPPPLLATLRPDWPTAAAGRLDAWFATLLAKDPAQRPADGAAWVTHARAAATDIEGRFGAANATNRL